MPYSKSIKCEICGKYFKSITPTHLKKHNISIKEYRSNYNNLTNSKASGIKKAKTLKNYIKLFGIINGAKRFDIYRKKHSFKNTYKAKKEKFGWTKEQFKKYNKSRAVTLENCIRRHGIDKGTTIFKEYCKKQSIAGVTKEWFINKLGKKNGELKWKQVRKSHGHSLENYIKKYGKIDGIKKYKSFFSKFLVQSNKSTSRIQLEFENLLFNKIKDFNIKFNIYSKITGKAFATYYREKNCCFIYDFVILFPIKLCIEFNGDYWHMNPKIYKETDFNKLMNKTAKEIWEYDKIKSNYIEKMKFNFITVWEKDYKENPIKEVEKCLEKIKELLRKKLNQ